MIIDAKRRAYHCMRAVYQTSKTARKRGVSFIGKSDLQNEAVLIWTLKKKDALLTAISATPLTIRVYLQPRTVVVHTASSPDGIKGFL